MPAGAPSWSAGAASRGVDAAGLGGGVHAAEPCTASCSPGAFTLPAVVRVRDKLNIQGSAWGYGRGCVQGYAFKASHRVRFEISIRCRVRVFCLLHRDRLD